MLLYIDLFQNEMRRKRSDLLKEKREEKKAKLTIKQPNVRLMLLK